MSTLLHIIDYIGTRHAIHHKKLRKNLPALGAEYEQRAAEFFERYQKLLDEDGRTIDYATDCYLRMLADLTSEAKLFMETGEYSSKSFAEVNARVYGDPAVMEYYMHGLLLSQFLWKHHYQMFCFFVEELGKRRHSIRQYLEIGGGHGFQVAEAARMLGDSASVTVVDISATSLNLARRLVQNDRVQYVHSDIFEYHPPTKFDFITIGEVLEHLENPGALLVRAGELLAENGRVFITTPANAPTIDHIYLFRNAAEIRDLIERSGFEIEAEFQRYAEDVTPEVAERFKISLLYGATLRRKS